MECKKNEFQIEKEAIERALDIAKESVYRTVMNCYGILKKETLINATNRREYAEARYVLMRGLKILGISKKEICLEVKKDRLTFKYGEKVINNLYSTDEKFRAMIIATDSFFYQYRQEFLDTLKKENIVVVKSRPKEKNVAIVMYSSSDILEEVSDFIASSPKKSLTQNAKDFLFELCHRMRELKNNSATSVN